MGVTKKREIPSLMKKGSRTPEEIRAAVRRVMKDRDTDAWTTLNVNLSLPDDFGCEELAPQCSPSISMPGGEAIGARYEVFQRELPSLCSNMGLSRDELTFADYTWLVKVWQDENP